MSDAILLRLAGLAALSGGLLRLTSGFFGMLLPDKALHAVWIATDFLLLFGMIGVFTATRTRAGVVGLIGLLVAVAGLILVRSSGQQLFGSASYDVAASIWGVGQALLAAAILVSGAGFTLSSWLWVAALAIGVAGKLVPPAVDEQLNLFLWSAIVFSAGFVCAGITLLRRSNPGESS